MMMIDILFALMAATLLSTCSMQDTVHYSFEAVRAKDRSK